MLFPPFAGGEEVVAGVVCTGSAYVVVSVSASATTDAVGAESRERPGGNDILDTLVVVVVVEDVRGG